MRQRTEITFETEETVQLRSGPAVVNEYCGACRDVMSMATPKAIAILAGVGERVIFRLIEDGKVHFIDKSGIYVCLNSMAVIKEEVKQ
jgi:hypothetical protein